MSNTWDDLRDLAYKLEVTAREHKAWSMVHHEVQTLIDHLLAKARVHQLNALAKAPEDPQIPIKSET